jgi:hypothetical protein
LANEQSYGFYRNIHEDDWEISRTIARERVNNMTGANLRAGALQFYQENWEPGFSCRHERRVGKMGDGEESGYAARIESKQRRLVARIVWSIVLGARVTSPLRLELQKSWVAIFMSLIQVTMGLALLRT